MGEGVFVSVFTRVRSRRHLFTRMYRIAVALNTIPMINAKICRGEEGRGRGGKRGEGYRDDEVRRRRDRRQFFVRSQQERGSHTRLTTQQAFGHSP